MAYEFKAAIICDNCKTRIESPTVEHRATSVARPLWDLKYLANKSGWMFLNRGRYLTEAHICPACADKPMPKIPKRKKPKWIIKELL